MKKTAWQIGVTVGLAITLLVDASPRVGATPSSTVLAEVGDSYRANQYAHQGYHYPKQKKYQQRNPSYQRQQNQQTYRYQTQRQNTYRTTPRYQNRYQTNPYPQNTYQQNHPQRGTYRGNQWYTDPNAGNQYRYSNQNSDSYSYSQQPSRYPSKHHLNASIPYGAKLCESGQYPCLTVKRGDTWAKLFPDRTQRDIVRRINRTNLKLQRGEQIAVPENLPALSLLDVAPFDRKISPTGEKLILVSLPKLAWAAYAANGELVRWGPVSGGKNWCGDINKPCNTIQGVFHVFDKKDGNCRSRSFPVDRGGGSPMPYCMFFHSGFALHGSYELPGYNASHGCVRLYKEDAQWLNEEFVDLPEFEQGRGTQVIVQTVDENRHLEAQVDQDDDEYEYEYQTEGDYY